jgi:hypothetical protein
MTLSLRTNVYNDSLREYFSGHPLEPARTTWALQLGTPRPLGRATALVVGMMIFGVSQQYRRLARVCPLSTAQSCAQETRNETQHG